MNLTRIKNQILQLQRCIVLVEGAEQNLEVVKTLPYYGLFGKEGEHSKDIATAEQLLISTQETLKTQLRIMADDNREEVKNG